MKNTSSRRWLTLVAATLLLLAGCASTSERMRAEGQALIEQGRIEEGLSRLEEAVREAPTDVQARTTLAVASERAVARLNEAGERALAADDVLGAETAFRRALAIGPNNARANAGLRAIVERAGLEDALKQAQEALKKGELDMAAKLSEGVLAVNPRHSGALKLRAQVSEARLREQTSFPALRSRLSKPVSLEFRDANLKMVFDVLARTSGINFVFDKDVRSDLKVTIFVKKIAVEDAIELLLLQSQLEKRVINENTLMIFPNTPQKLKDYQDLVIKSFYLANADAKQTLNMIKTILKTKDVYIDEKLNLLIMRDTPDAVRIAEKLIAGQDIAEPEVVLEVAVMEVVKRNADRYGIGASLEQVAPFTITIRDDYRIDGPATLSGAIRITARSTESSGNLLANPKIRVKNKEKARVLIGDRVPVISSSTTPVSGTGTTGASNIVVSQSVQYLDTGLKLEVEPLIHLEEDVQIKLNLEVNTLGDQTTTDQGTVAYRVGTRTANTTLRLKDGETATFSGLIRDDDVRDALKVPGLGDLPVLGRIFANRGTDVTRTEIVLAITPRIVRNVRHQMPSVTEIISGSETALRARLPGQRPVVESEALPLKGAPGAAPRPPAAPSPAPAEPAEPASSTAPTSEAPVSLAWHGTQAVRTGQEFLLALQGTSDQPLLSTAMQIAFDPNALRAVDVIEGDLLKREGAQTNFSQRVDQASGKIYVGLSRAGASGVSGTGSLILVKFAATAAPASPIQVTVFSGVGAGNKLLPANLPPPFELKMLP